MGVYSTPCQKCNEPFIWFSNAPQICSKCMDLGPVVLNREELATIMKALKMAIVTQEKLELTASLNLLVRLQKLTQS